MGANRSVINLTRGYYIRYKYALYSIENCCSAEWVEEGISIRDLTLAEVVAKRAAQEKLLTDPLAFAELPGIVFRPPTHAIPSNQASQDLAEEARKFFRLAQINA